MLSSIPLEIEIKKSIWSLHPLKSSGPDGFSGIFYRRYWNIVKEKLANFVREVFRYGNILECSNRSFIVLIPKMNNASNFNQFRPISLCNFAYKVVAKILATRLSRILEKLMSLNQRAFMKGRWIAENSVIAQEVVYRVKKHKGKRGLMIMKIDIKKAYDSMEWSFIIRVLKAYGFSDQFWRLIYSCLNSVTFNFLINGSVSKKFKPSRGLRQSSILFAFYNWIEGSL